MLLYLEPTKWQEDFRNPSNRDSGDLACSRQTNWEMGLSGIHIYYVAFFHDALSQFKGESSLKLPSDTKADSIYLENFEKEV